jgi:hypothetical protein
LVSLIVNAHEIILFGTRKSEIWYDAGNALFPFAMLPGAYVEWGCLAPRSIAAADTNVYWLAQGLPGTGLILRQRRYETKVISNYAISYAINQMRAAGADLSDAVGWTYTLEGHIYYAINFISGNQTWVYDESIGDPHLAWHQLAWTDTQGTLNRHRGQAQAFFNGVPIVQDWQNGTIYELDPDYYFDDVDDGTGVGVVQMPISYIRTFPQILMGMQGGQPMMVDDKAIRINKFVADIECGNGPLDVNGNPPSVSLRVSLDRGRTYGDAIQQSTGLIGEFDVSPLYQTPGVGRYPVLELSYSFAGKAPLNGGWIDAEVLRQ